MSGHDTLCPWPDSGSVTHCDPCALIARTRADERKVARTEWNQAATMAESIQYETGYCDGMAAAAKTVVDYAQETHQPHNPRISCQRCDITAALLTASKRINKVGCID